MVRISDGVSDGARVSVNLVVVAPFRGLVAEEVNVLVGDAPLDLGIILDMTQAVGLVPTIGEDIK